MPYGPCQMCGATNYSLSMGGPGICPSCDCGIPPEVSRLKQRIAELNEDMKFSGVGITDLPCGWHIGTHEGSIKVYVSNDSGNVTVESDEVGGQVVCKIKIKEA